MTLIKIMPDERLTIRRGGYQEQGQVLQIWARLVWEGDLCWAQQRPLIWTAFLVCEYAQCSLEVANFMARQGRATWRAHMMI